MSPLPATTGVPAREPRRTSDVGAQASDHGRGADDLRQFGALHTEGIEQFVRPLPGGGVTEERPR